MQFRQPTPWEVYRWRIITIVSISFLQTGLIIVLLINRAKRRRAEQAAHALSRRLIHAQEEERARLARELHDDVTQRLARLAIDAGRLDRGMNGDSAGEVMRSVRDGLVRLSADIHALSYRLHPSVLEDLGLAEALKAECERFSRQESIPSDLKLGDLPAGIPPDPALCLFRVAQGALRNVARHARARGVQVLLRGMDGGVQLAVRDDGIGFDPTVQKNPRTLGLASMDERVHLAGGELDIESAPGHGTTIVAWVPLETKSWRNL
jgi:signal transduction histidine kinase